MTDQLNAYETTGSSPPHKVTLTRVTLIPGYTLGIGIAQDAQGGEVTFAGDWRALVQCSEALEAGETVEVYLEDWQILAFRRTA